MNLTYIATPKALNPIQSHKNFVIRSDYNWLDSYSDIIQESDWIEHIKTKLKRSHKNGFFFNLYTTKRFLLCVNMTCI